LLPGFIFKLEEEESTALLLHLPLLIAETAVFGSASVLGCCLVVAIAQATVNGKGSKCLRIQIRR
jgi:hypothetical protein